MTYISTGIKKLDKKIKTKKDEPSFILTGALPGQGKTAFVLQTAYYSAMNKSRVVYIAMECTAEEIEEKLKKRNMTDYDPDYLKPINLTGTDTNPDLIMKTVNEAGKCDLLIIDYSDIVKSEDGIVWKLREYCKEQNTHVILTTRLVMDENIYKTINLFMNSGTEKIFDLVDIALFTYFDPILSLSQDDYDKPRIILSKNRQEGICDISCRFNLDKGIFEDK